MESLLIALFTLLLFLISVFSYTQVDLNLTLSSNYIYQSLQSKLLFLGYYQRQTSSIIFLILVTALYFIYFYFLKTFNHNIGRKSKIIFYCVLISAFAGLISYPFLSHDFFNYLFDARIVTKYHLNPYYFKALDFPDDLWTRFMHWTHRTYPYGPLWLLTTLPFSFLGIGKFVLTVFLFKLMFVLVYFLNIKLIRDITLKLNSKYTFSAVIFFALNPLIIIETLISPHNESLMLLFLLLSLKSFLIYKKRIQSLNWLLASVAVKFVTAILIPINLFVSPKSELKKVVLICVGLLSIPLIIEIWQREAYPWYFVPILGVSSISALNKLHFFLIVLSYGALLRYLPYLMLGEYSKSSVLNMNLLLILPIFLYFTFQLIKRKYP